MNTPAESILLAMIDAADSESATAGRTPSGNLYTYTIGNVVAPNYGGVKGIYSVVLPFESAVHVLGIPNAGEQVLDSASIGSYMTSVQLEGDYSKYFKIYTDNDKQFEVRYLLDPEAMAYSAEFLKTYCWEVRNRSLYFFDDSSLPNLEVIDSFIINLQPSTTASPLYKLSIIKAKEILRPYFGKLKCPLCNVKLLQGKDWLACPEGHGYLMTGSQLINTRIDSSSFMKELSGMLGRTPKFYTDIQKTEHATIICPNCSQTMDVRKYQYTNINIDVCTNCPYRWLDGVELNAILGPYRSE